MMSSEQALKIGLVDEVVPQDTLYEKAQAEVLTWLKVPGTCVLFSCWQYLSFWMFCWEIVLYVFYLYKAQ